VHELLEKTEITPRPEAWAYYTLEFRLPIFEVLSIEPDFDAKPPELAIVVANHSSFHLRRVAATVRVMAPQEAKTLRLYRRRMDVDFAPKTKQTLRVPVGREWATGRNSFLVDVDPVPPKVETDGAED
jgi:hypothetical protein